MISGNPTFESDKVSVPLQAADMLAWSIRRGHEEPQPAAALTRMLLGRRHFATEIEQQSLEKWFREMSNIPGARQLQTKARWADMRRELRRLRAAGYIPPHGTRLKNMIHRIRAAIARAFRW
jgi:hypothetical protein